MSFVGFVKFDYDLSWMQEKNSPDQPCNHDTPLLEPREIKNKYISLMTQYVDDANRYYFTKFGGYKHIEYVDDNDPARIHSGGQSSAVSLWWTFCAGFNDEINPHSSYFLVWGTNSSNFHNGKKDPKAIFLYKGMPDMFRRSCTKENLDEWEQYILENV